MLTQQILQMHYRDSLFIIQPTDNWQSFVFGTDIQTESYNNDKGSNLKITGTLLWEIPIDSQLSIGLTASSIISSTICGLVESGTTGFVTECTIQANNVNYNLTKQSACFNVCCYNISIGTTAIKVTTLLTSVHQ